MVGAPGGALARGGCLAIIVPNAQIKRKMFITALTGVCDQKGFSASIIEMAAELPNTHKS